ncbi:MAG: hypothetical protein Q9190_005970 [Brigantiaea leucoxantha]
MDPVSLCAAILTMVDTAKGGVRGLRRIKRLWSAPQEIEDLVFEIESLQSTLRDISDFIDVAQSMLYSQTLSQPVSRASSILDSIATLFSSSPFHLTHLTDATRARLVWLQHKNEIKNLFEILRSVRVDLSLKLGLVVAFSAARTEKSLSTSNDQLSHQLAIVISQQADINNALQVPTQKSVTGTSNNNGPRNAVMKPLITDHTVSLETNVEAFSPANMFAKGKASPFDLNPVSTDVLGYTAHNNVLGYTAHLEDYRVSQFLIAQGADPSHPNSSEISASEGLLDSAFAGRFGDEGISIVCSMVNDYDFLETRGLSTLHKSVLGINKIDLRALLESSTASIDDGDSRKRTALAWVVIRDDIDAVKILLEFKANPNFVDGSGRSPLFFVKSAAVCRALLQAGSDINVRSAHSGRSALHQLCRTNGTVEPINLLTSAGIDVNVQDADHETPLLVAVFWHLTAAAERLIDLGANVNAVNISCRDNSLHFAVGCSHHHIIPLLLAHNVDFKAINVDGRNIVHMAAISADTATMNTLTESGLHGVDLALRDVEGKTPADYIAEREIFAESEIGLHEAFDALVRSMST